MGPDGMKFDLAI